MRQNKMKYELGLIGALALSGCTKYEDLSFDNGRCIAKLSGQELVEEKLDYSQQATLSEFEKQFYVEVKYKQDCQRDECLEIESNIEMITSKRDELLEGTGVKSKWTHSTSYDANCGRQNINFSYVHSVPVINRWLNKLLE